MRFTETPIAGAFAVDLDLRRDERGWFARSWCRQEFVDHGLDGGLVQCNISYNESAGTLRGLHFQKPPKAEAKLVRCVRGAVFDVIVDLRPESRSYRRWHALTLDADAHNALYIPHGVAHGFQTLTDRSEVHYQMSEAFSPEHASGVRWDDQAFAIAWPATPRRIVSAKDAAYPDFAR